MTKPISQPRKSLPPANPQVQLTPELSAHLKSIADELEAAYRADHTPPFTRWHLVGLLSVSLLLFGQQYAPGLMADLGRIELAGDAAAVLARVTTIILGMVALFVARSMHPLTALAMWLGVVGLCFRLGEVRVTEEPLTLAFALVLACISVVAIRVIVRPNETDQIHILKARLAALENYVEQCQQACPNQPQQGVSHDS